MVDYLVHYYRRGTEPFQTLSELSDAEAIERMCGLYREGSVFWERFQDPARYLHARRAAERWMHDAFTRKGGRPKFSCPLYLVLGHSPWARRVKDPVTTETTAEIEVPLSIFDESEISFTYPDSMVSLLVAEGRDPELFQPGYHGELFTLSEIRAIVARKGMPGEGWETKVPDTFAHYIEAQVWSRETVRNWYRAAVGATRSDTREH